MGMTCCGEAARLLDAYKAALAAFESASGSGIQSLAPNHITFQEARQANELAHGVLLRARRLSWKHIEQHGCRRSHPNQAEIRQRTPEARL